MRNMHSNSVIEMSIKRHPSIKMTSSPGWGGWGGGGDGVGGVVFTERNYHLTTPQH